MCGGSSARGRNARQTQGLSPRVRGKRPAPLPRQTRHRSIPACAGEAWSARPPSHHPRVYPRVCGGSPPRPLQRWWQWGLSPRVRGKLNLKRRHPRNERSIPACAGEAAVSTLMAYARKVYPRVCGGSCQRWRRRRCSCGLSPRVRGKLNAMAPYPHPAGSIPACAGEAAPFPATAPQRPVYPRVCGGSVAHHQPLGLTPGLSPRVRGKLGFQPVRGGAGGSIPACAGEAPSAWPGAFQDKVYPRVCGGSVSGEVSGRAAAGLSPRVRGKPYHRGRGRPSAGSIPACAGEALGRRCTPWCRWVYPRVCGGSWPITPIGRPATGLSPRVRGKRHRG